MILIILLSIVKTFFFLRIFGSLSYIVTMLTNVIYDLRVFFIFYMSLIFLFSLIFGVLGIGNYKVPSDFTEFLDELPDDFESMRGGDTPNEQYKNIGPFVANILYTFRASLGDFDADTSTFLSPAENWIFWVCWFIIVNITCIVFLNFIISEIGDSYGRLKPRLEGMIMKERASLITEAD
jgi:hypothetical protein